MTINNEYAGFQNLNINWTNLRRIYRPEIEAGVSRGRFSGIMSHLSLQLREFHTFMLDRGIVGGSIIRLGIHESVVA